MSTAYKALDRLVMPDLPDDLDEAAVDADRLLDLGDPRGELIAVQVQLARDPYSIEARSKEERLLDMYGDAWVAGASHIGLRLEWRFGFVDAITADLDRVADSTVVARLIRQPAVARLRSLCLGGEDRRITVAPIVEALLDVAPPLRELVCDFPWPNDVDLGTHGADLGDLEGLWALPLEHVALKTHAVALGDIVAPALRHFALLTPYGPSELDARAITRAAWPQLETLVVGRCNIPLAQMRRILAARDLPRLTRLELFEVPGDVLMALADSELLVQLRELELSWRRGEPIPPLDPHGPRFAHLERFIYA